MTSSSSCASLVIALCTGALEGWFAQCVSPAIWLIWHAAALELSILFVSCLTLLSMNLSKSTLPSLMVLDTNSPSHNKKPEYVSMQDLSCFWGVSCQVDLCLHYIVPFHLHCVCIGRSLWEGQSMLPPHLHVACKTPHTFLRFYLDWALLKTNTMRHIGPCQSLCSRQSLSYIFVTQAKQQAQIPKYSYISRTTFKTFGKAHH